MNFNLYLDHIFKIIKNKWQLIQIEKKIHKKIPTKKIKN